MIKSFSKSESGTTAIEYALIAALIALVISGSLILVGSSLKKPMNTISETLNNQP